MSITLDISVPDEVKPAFESTDRVVVRNTQDGVARRALLWWAWAHEALWISVRPRNAARDLDALLELYPRLRSSRIQFRAPKDLSWDAPDCVVVEQSDDLDDVSSWLNARDVKYVRVLEPSAEIVQPNRCVTDGLSVGDMRSFLDDVRGGESLPEGHDYEEHELVDALTAASFVDFVREFWHAVVPERYVENFHIPYLADELQAIAERVFKNLPKLYDLIINIAPGETKSLLVSVFFPAWVWRRMPSARFIGASYAQPLAMDLGRKTKDVVLSRAYQRGSPFSLREDQSGKSFFMNDRGGMRLAVGTGGIAGFHAHFIGIDDPLDPNKFASDVEIKGCNDWIKTNLEQRKIDQDVSPTILVMQRVAQNDPTQDKLNRSAGRVRHICLPAEDRPWVQPIELRAKYVDGLMDPHRLPEKVLAEKRLLGDFIYSGQYLQRPSPPGGTKFKISKIELVEPPSGMSLHEWVNGQMRHRWRGLVRYWDKAASKDSGCYTVGALMGEDIDGHFWVLDVVRFRQDTGAREARIKQTTFLDGHRVTVGIELEGGSGGKDSAVMTTKSLAGYRVIADRPDKNKELRADPFSTQVNVSNVSVINAEWTRDYLNELEFFPGSTFKDQVDASSGAFKILTQKKREIKVPKNKRS